MKYLIDTNIISNGTKPAPSIDLDNWLSKQPNKSLYISSITIAEVARGIRLLPEGKRKTDLLSWLDKVINFYEGRILDFDINAAMIWADFMSNGAKNGKSRPYIDTMIGAIAKANNCTIVTNNEKDFLDFEVFNPIKIA